MLTVEKLCHIDHNGPRKSTNMLFCNFVHDKYLPPMPCPLPPFAPQDYKFGAAHVTY